jgi:hypothetical protein
MTISLLFWILFIVGFVLGGYRNRDGFGVWLGDSLFWWVLIFLLGIGTFGWPIK